MRAPGINLANGVKAGITGSLASGKTTALGFFRQAGWRTISADRIAHQLLKKRSFFYDRIVRRFGKEILSANGEISRKKLGKIVFADKKERKFLESQLHPGIKKRIAELVKKAGNLAVENSLLFQMKTENLFDFVIYITVTPSKKPENLKRRKIPPREAKLILKAQGSAALRKADFVVKNNSSVSALRKKINKIIQAISYPC
ncbi:MAG: dephospho-CoA kinase [bacterium]